MIIVMKKGSSREDLAQVTGTAESLGFRAHVLPGTDRATVLVMGSAGGMDPDLFERLPFVASAIPLSQPFKLVSREVKAEDTIVKVGSQAVGDGGLFVIAGPCAVESAEQILETADVLKRAGADALRGGAFKPRSSPYSFQGLGKKGLLLLAKAREATGLPIVTEAVDEASCELVAEYADVIQIGARNMQNFELLKRAGKAREAGAPEAGDVGDARGPALGRRVRAHRREPERHPLRARHPDVFPAQPVHARSVGHSRRSRASATFRSSSIRATRRVTATACPRWPGPRSPQARTA